MEQEKKPLLSALTSASWTSGDELAPSDNSCDAVVDAIGMRLWQWLYVFLMGARGRRPDDAAAATRIVHQPLHAAAATRIARRRRS